VPKEQAECQGKAYEDAGFTTGDMAKIDKGDFDFSTSAGKKFAAAITQCLGISSPPTT
jgi:hypothetical protein